MNSRFTRLTLCALLGVLCRLAPAGETPATRKPNILFILADDLGWADVTFHHGKVPTPNLDKLAAEGVELTQHYVFPVCSPTRSATDRAMKMPGEVAALRTTLEQLSKADRDALAED